MEGRELRELKELGNRLVGELGRLADANEAIVRLAGEQQEQMEAPQPGPPFCPHCGAFNPVIVSDQEGTGPMSDFVLVAHCKNCDKMFFGVPDGWTVLATADEARELLDERKGGHGGS